MTRQKAMERLFTAYGGKANSERGKIYLEQVVGWRETVLDAAVTRVLGTWPHISLPPVAKLVAACRELDREDRSYRGSRDPKPEGSAQRMSEADKQLCRLMAELFDMGLDFCEATSCWVAWGEAKRLTEDHPQYQTMTVEGCEAALAAVMRGALVGNQAMHEWRKGEGRALTQPLREQIERPVALPEPSRAQEEVFD